jgi:hypothetical protein
VGCGKSTLATTVANQLGEMEHFCASLFFNRDIEERSRYVACVFGKLDIGLTLTRYPDVLRANSIVSKKVRKVNYSIISRVL